MQLGIPVAVCPEHVVALFPETRKVTPAFLVKFLSAKPTTLHGLMPSATARVLKYLLDSEVPVQSLFNLPLLKDNNGNPVTIVERGGRGAVLHHSPVVDPSTLFAVPALHCEIYKNVVGCKRWSTFADLTNLNEFSLLDAASLLPTVLPKSLGPEAGTSEDPNLANLVIHGQPAVDWFANLWALLESLRACASDAFDLAVLHTWQIVPDTDGQLHSCCGDSRLLDLSDDIFHESQDVFETLGCRKISEELVPKSLRSLIYQPSTVSGAIRAISVCFTYSTADLIDDDMARGIWKFLGSQISNLKRADLGILKQLAIWQSFQADEQGNLHLARAPISPQAWLPPITMSIGISLADCHHPMGIEELEFLKLAGVHVRGFNDFVVNHAKDFDKLSNDTMGSLFTDLIQVQVMAKKTSEAAIRALASSPFVVTPSGERKPPSALFDPAIPELCELLDQSLNFPSEQFASEQGLIILRALGLQVNITRSALLQAALDIHNRCTEEGDPQLMDAARMAGGKLLRYLDVNAEALFAPKKKRKKGLFSL